MAMLENIHGSLLRIPDGDDLTSSPHQTPYYLNWDFTIYRTEYGGFSHQSWKALLAKVQSQIAVELETHQEDKGDDEQTQTRGRLQDMFRLDTLSDAGLLQNKSMKDICQLFMEPLGNNKSADGTARHPLNAAVQNQMHQHGYFLLADAEVLQDAGREVNPQFWVKSVRQTIWQLIMYLRIRI
jgi:hypothetical protein